MRPQPDDLRLKTEFGVGRDWPLSYTQLEPYFDEAERWLGVSGPHPYPWGPARTPLSETAFAAERRSGDDAGRLCDPGNHHGAGTERGAVQPL